MIAFGLSAIYLVLSWIVVGYKADQLVLVGLFNSMYFLGVTTRKFIVAFSVFIVYWVIFDYMKAIPNYRFHSVHIKSLFIAEKNLFGINSPQGTLTPNEYLSIHAKPWLDIATGFFYLCWVPLPLVFAGILFFKSRKHYFYFALTFLLVNIIGFIGYYIYPAAPPWYVQQYGFEFHAGIPGNTAGLHRFDDFFHVPIFSSIYAKSSNVFAAMPSLHAAYPLLVLFYGIKYRFGLWNFLFGTITLGIWFAAVYNYHHYVLDVLAGIFCGILGISISEILLARTNNGRMLMDHLFSSIE